MPAIMAKQMMRPAHRIPPIRMVAHFEHTALGCNRTTVTTYLALVRHNNTIRCHTCKHSTAACTRICSAANNRLQPQRNENPQKQKKRKNRDPDKLFLLSLYEKIKRVPEEIRLDVKGELIQVLKKYQKKPPVKQEKPQS
ncbi:uncharacterized protein LOC120781382 [Bactrocera tryoni]|uniref:uncharacterized protein LOC120781382 n=1 Tax=Bactrocera tryoni TaxID=59916 RepID=UPI001A9639B9|nr:uncharacterized protein LOC120781382 [Bactrocera tryoni]